MKKKMQILFKFCYKWVLPKAFDLALVLLALWVIGSTAEIGLADCATIGRNYWEGNFWLVIMQLFA
jgi:hypothetical protein